MKDALKAKKLGQELTGAQIQEWIKGVTAGTVPDYQTAALLMAIRLRGMNVTERGALTHAMAGSGIRLNLEGAPGFIVDKHSTGGIGDKTSLILAPLIACLGGVVPMISGRGLGFTGGTLDKLESIPGFRTDLTVPQMEAQAKSLGCFMAGQTAQIAPADRKIYALRDVTETVDDISLITASILSKKFSESLQGLVLDVKCGSGAFMKSAAEAKELAESLVGTCRSAGLKADALVTRMDEPLGEFTGNVCEAGECIHLMKSGSAYHEMFRAGEKEILSGKPGKNSRENLLLLTVRLALSMLRFYRKEDDTTLLQRIDEIWKENLLHDKFAAMTAAQKGDLSSFDFIWHIVQDKFAKGGGITDIRAADDGFLTAVNGEEIGECLVDLGAGRRKAEDSVEHSVSLQTVASYGPVKKDQVLCRVLPGKKPLTPEIQTRLQQAFTINSAAGAEKALFL